MKLKFMMFSNAMRIHFEYVSNQLWPILHFYSDPRDGGDDQRPESESRLLSLVQHGATGVHLQLAHLADTRPQG